MHRRLRRTWLPAIGLLNGLLLLISGCARTERSSVGGDVTLDSVPLQKGGILFAPVKNSAGFVAGGDIVDGHYQLDSSRGPMSGEYSVEITAVRPTGKMVQSPMGPPGKLIEVYEGAIPARYNSATTLRATIAPGENTANFELQSH